MSNVSEVAQSGQGGWRAVIVACAVLLAVLTMAQVPAAPLKRLVEVRTTAGNMIIALHNETPLHRDNFLKLVRAGAYDSLLFHRVIPGFMVQAGDPDSRTAPPRALLGEAPPKHTLPPEIVPGMIHRRGALAAVRQSDDVNPERRSNGSQFFIVQGHTYGAAELDQVAARNARYGSLVSYTPDQRRTYANEGGAPHLDGAYTVFGEVVEGLEVIDAIARSACDGHDRPLTDIRLFMRVME